MLCVYVDFWHCLIYCNCFLVETDHSCFSRVLLFLHAVAFLTYFLWILYKINDFRCEVVFHFHVISAFKDCFNIVNTLKENYKECFSCTYYLLFVFNGILKALNGYLHGYLWLLTHLMKIISQNNSVFDLFTKDLRIVSHVD